MRRSAIEPVIGHLKTEGHLGRCHLKGRAGDCLRDLRAPHLLKTGRLPVTSEPMRHAFLRSGSSDSRSASGHKVCTHDPFGWTIRLWFCCICWSWAAIPPSTPNRPP